MSTNQDFSIKIMDHRAPLVVDSLPYRGYRYLHGHNLTNPAKITLNGNQKASPMKNIL
jgi:hypothetical protein